MSLKNMLPMACCHGMTAVIRVQRTHDTGLHSAAFVSGAGSHRHLCSVSVKGGLNLYGPLVVSLIRCEEPTHDGMVQ